MSFFKWLGNLFRRQEEKVIRSGPLSLISPETVEIFAQPGHGKTSLLWSLLYMLRQLSLAWPNYVCWPQDDGTAGALVAAHERVQRGEPPPPTGGAEAARYALVLQHMERWGRQRLLLWDRPDPVFGMREESDDRPEPSWGVPAWWLLSLPDLDDVQEQLLDLRFDELLRSRAQSGRALYTDPLQLVIVLTKADAISDLPPVLRNYLKHDPLWRAVRGEQQATDGRQAVPPRSQWSSLDELQPEVPRDSGAAVGTADRVPSDPTQRYVATLWRVHQEIQRWLERTTSGYTLVRRAAEYHVELRFAIVSATGSAISGGAGGQLPWSPRRVLDPLFWALELAAASGRAAGAWRRRPAA